MPSHPPARTRSLVKIPIARSGASVRCLSIGTLAPSFRAEVGTIERRLLCLHARIGEAVPQEFNDVVDLRLRDLKCQKLRVDGRSDIRIGALPALLVELHDGREVVPGAFAGVEQPEGLTQADVPERRGLELTRGGTRRS